MESFTIFTASSNTTSVSGVLASPSGVTVLAAVQGTANYSSLYLRMTPGAYNLSFSEWSEGVTPITSASVSGVRGLHI